MDVKLVCLNGKHPGQAIPVRGPKFFVGRAEDCQLRPGSQEVSRHHAVILVEEGFISVRDFGSRNGTFVNEEPVHGECELKSGDRLRIGPLEFEVQLTVAVGGKKKPKVATVREAAARTAAPATQTGDVDVSEWFGEEDGLPGQASKSETQVGAPADSTAIMSQGKKVAPEKAEPEKKKYKLTAPATSLPKPKSATSEDAAADVLRKLMGH